MTKMILISQLAHILTLVERDMDHFRPVGDDPIADTFDDICTTLQSITGLDDNKMRSMGFDKIISLAMEAD